MTKKRVKKEEKETKKKKKRRIKHSPLFSPASDLRKRNEYTPKVTLFIRKRGDRRHLKEL